MRQIRGRHIGPAPTPRRLFVFGLGYSALVVARRLKSRGWTVAGTCQSEEKRQALVAEGIAATLFDGTRPLAERNALANATYVLSSVPPDGERDPVLAHHAGDLAALQSVKWV